MSESEQEFNLLDEPWIKVLCKDFNVKEVSTIEFFRNAHNYICLAGESKGQDVAVLRHLLAIVHTVFSRVDENGNESPIKDTDTAIDRWEALWNFKKFPVEPIIRYLEKYRNRFYLFDPKYPFYQVPGAKTGINGNNPGTYYSTKKLYTDICESTNKPRLFTSKSGEEGKRMNYAEAARSLLYLNAYDDTSVKPKRSEKDGRKSAGTGWLGKTGVVTASGRNMFETLVLNLTLLKDGEELWGENKPVWERETVHDLEGEEIPLPDNQAELLTTQSRLMLLEREDGYVIGFYNLTGEFWQKENAFSEQMICWYKTGKTKEEIYRPSRHERNRFIWRELPGLVKQVQGQKRPGVICWLARLKDEGVLPDDYPITLNTCQVDYIKKNFAPNDTFGDTLSFMSVVLSDKGSVWQDLILDEISMTEIVGSYIDYLQRRISESGGDNEDTFKKLGERAKEDFLARMDVPFRIWIRTLNADQGPEERDAKRKEWQDMVLGTARKLGRRMAINASQAEQRGRKIEIKNDAGKVIERRFISASDALNLFQHQIAKLEGGVKGDGNTAGCEKPDEAKTVMANQAAREQ